MLTHKNVTSTISALNLTFNVNSNDRHVSYLPLSHAFERMILWDMLANGGSITSFQGDVLKLKDDWAMVRPTLIPIVPRLL